ncbi:MAG: hypothetical protein AB7Y46_13445 [Armatimonadota bacterium]
MRGTLTMVGATVAVASSVMAQTAGIREIGGNKQLFIDEEMVQSMEGVAFTLNPARRAGPVLFPDAPWEPTGLGYVTVLHDGEKFRMYYGSWEFREDIKGNWMDRVAYAESDDGIHWRKPILGQMQYEGSTANNLLMLGHCGGYVHGGSVFIDPHATSPAERYKMIFGDFYRIYPYEGCPQHTTISGATSADGIRWTGLDTPHGLLFPSGGTDTQNVCFWDPYRQAYVAYTRVNVYRKDEDGEPYGQASRRIGRSESPVFREFPPAEEIAAPDEDDPGGEWGCGLYNSAATLYDWAPGVYLFFPSVQHYDTGLVEITFASSRDGIHLDRRFRQPYVPIDPAAVRLGDQIGYSAYMGPGMIRVGDELWMYGIEHSTPHISRWYGRRIEGAIHRYLQRLDGFVSLDAAGKPGTVTTKPFVLRGSRLEINANAAIAPPNPPGEAGSTLVVELLDLEGNVLAASEPIHDDGVALRPTWRGGVDLAQFIGRAVQLRFTLDMAKLYAFQVADAEPVAIQIAPH